MKREAACACGTLRLTTDREPVRISICHCLDCQRRTGSVFGAQARFPRSAVNIDGRSNAFVRVGDSGSAIQFHFCPECGSTVFYTLDQTPDLIAVAVGAFGDPTFPAPRVSVYESRKHPWVEMRCELEREE